MERHDRAFPRYEIRYALIVSIGKIVLDSVQLQCQHKAIHTLYKHISCHIHTHSSNKPVCIANTNSSAKATCRTLRRKFCIIYCTFVHVCLLQCKGCMSSITLLHKNDIYNITHHLWVGGNISFGGVTGSKLQYFYMT